MRLSLESPTQGQKLLTQLENISKKTGTKKVDMGSLKERCDVWGLEATNPFK